MFSPSVVLLRKQICPWTLEEELEDSQANVEGNERCCMVCGFVSELNQHQQALQPRNMNPDEIISFFFTERALQPNEKPYIPRGDKHRPQKCPSTYKICSDSVHIYKGHSSLPCRLSPLPIAGPIY